MAHMKITIHDNEDEESAKKLAAIVAELVRQGVNFEVNENGTDFIIEFNGGF